MELKFKLTDSINSFIEKAELCEINIGCSNSQVIKIEKEKNIYYLKIAKYPLLTDEYKKLCWLSGKLSVPKVIKYEINDEVEYLITESLQGEMICSKYYLDNPDEGLDILIEAFNQMYQMDISDCPYNVSLDYKLNLAKENIDNNLINLDAITPQILKQYKTPQKIYEYLIEHKFKEKICFSHGDISLPNVFGFNHSFAGFIDIGECGIADKWFDIAIATRTIKMNYGELYVKKFYDKLGIEVDENKINYYLLLMELYL